ncbi:MAG: hypothetical protein ABIM44_05700 [candidate division WOR-3 bacterium]
MIVLYFNNYKDLNKFIKEENIKLKLKLKIEKKYKLHVKGKLIDNKNNVEKGFFNFDLSIEIKQLFLHLYEEQKT